MKIRVPNYYKDFKCIGSACEDTCCSGWDVVIDSETYEVYQKMDGAFGDRLRSKMVVDQDGDNIFVLDGERCPFLDNNNLCDIHGDIGEEYLCYTCKQYPRYEESFDNLREMGISLSCPEAARIIFRHTSLTEVELSEDSQLSEKAVGEDKVVLEEFFQCRATIIDIIEVVDIPLGIRAVIVLRFVEELQDKISFGELDAIKQISRKYSDKNHIKGLVEDLHLYTGNEVAKYKDVHEYFKTYRDLEHINENDPLGLNKVLGTFWNSEADRIRHIEGHKTFNHYYNKEADNFKKILIYFIYRYFMKSFYDYDMSSKIKVAMISTIMIKELAVIRWLDNNEFTEVDMVDISHEYSKDVEHLVENVEMLERIFETEEVYSVDKIINTLMLTFNFN